MNTNRMKKTIIKALPYVFMGFVCTNLGEAWRLAEGADASKKLLSFFSTLGPAVANPLPSFHPVDLLVGAICGGAGGHTHLNAKLITLLHLHKSPPQKIKFAGRGPAGRKPAGRDLLAQELPWSCWPKTCWPKTCGTKPAAVVLRAVTC